MFVNFFSLSPILLYKRRTLSGQYPHKVSKYLEYETTFSNQLIFLIHQNHWVSKILFFVVVVKLAISSYEKRKIKKNLHWPYWFKSFFIWYTLGSDKKKSKQSNKLVNLTSHIKILRSHNNCHLVYILFKTPLQNEKSNWSAPLTPREEIDHSCFL